MLVIDGGANVCLAASMLQDSYPDLLVSNCACHILNTITKYILTDKLDEFVDDLEEDFALENEDEEFKELLNHILCQQFTSTFEKCRLVCRHFSHSVKSSELLKEKLKKHCIKGYTKLIQPNTTRWNSNFFCLKRILDCKEALEHTFICIKRKVSLDDEDFNKISLMLKLLQPFQTSSVQLQEDELTYGNIVPSIVTIYCSLEVNSI